MTMVSYVPTTGVHWHPVRSNSIQNFPFSAVESPIGAKDSNHTSEDWRTGFLECGNEHTVYIVFRSGFQIGSGAEHR
jgi:hypothetical protein